MTGNEQVVPNKMRNMPDKYISDMVFADLPEVGPALLVTSWDCALYIYRRVVNPENKEQSIELIKLIRNDSPLLCTCVVKDEIYVGTVTGELLRYDQTHDCFVPAVGLSRSIATMGVCKLLPYQRVDGDYIICVSWDGTINVMDVKRRNLDVWVRAAVEEKVITADSDNNHLVIAITRQKVLLYDLPLSAGSISKVIVPTLKNQIRDIKLLPSKDGYVISTIDGRVAVEYFEERDQQKQFAFRCHRTTLSDVQLVYPVNTLSFIPGTVKLFTGGSDGSVTLWNLETKRKIKQFDKLTTLSVVKLIANDNTLYVGISDDSFKTVPVGSEGTEMALLPSSINIISL